MRPAGIRFVTIYRDLVATTCCVRIHVGSSSCFRCVVQDAHLEASNPLALWLPGFELPANIDSTASPNETASTLRRPHWLEHSLEEATLEFQLQWEGRSQFLTRHVVLANVEGGAAASTNSGYRGEVRIVGWDKSLRL